MWNLEILKEINNFTGLAVAGLAMIVLIVFFRNRKNLKNAIQNGKKITALENNHQYHEELIAHILIDIKGLLSKIDDKFDEHNILTTRIFDKINK